MLVLVTHSTSLRVRVSECVMAWNKMSRMCPLSVVWSKLSVTCPSEHCGSAMPLGLHVCLVWGELTHPCVIQMCVCVKLKKMPAYIRRVCLCFSFLEGYECVLYTSDGHKM